MRSSSQAPQRHANQLINSETVRKSVDILRHTLCETQYVAITSDLPQSTQMALPPGFLDDLRSRLSISDVVARKVIWDARKSNPAKGDFWAPCPFHQEKTASFHVDDRKGFYYCFGCHQKGDMINFVKETDNVSFIEAVEILCREAGVDMPQQSRDPHAAEKRDRATKLVDVMEQSVKAFGLAFRSAGGQKVRDYVSGRRLTEETAKRFEIGFAPDSRTQLTTMFREKGLLDEAIAAGMIIKPDDGGQPYDRFRNRLMFPIRDQRGRCIGFGGRAMDPNARAKYLNSPATELFDKSRVLYNYGPAREAAGKTQALIVAEGYMDVIALAQAGFDHAVAPNGTAITEQQLTMMWKVADEPIIALDGDKAGMRAAERLIDLALPLLQPGKSLRFCVLPEGRDPDDLIKAEGPSAMQEALDAAHPLIEMLWRRETERETLDTPERKAALDQRLRKLLGTINDPGVRAHYGADFKSRRAALFAPAAKPANRTGAPMPFQPGQGRGFGGALGKRGNGRGGYATAKPARETLTSELARKSSASITEIRIREAAILLIALRNPTVLEHVEDALEGAPFVADDTRMIRNALLDAPTECPDVVAFIETRMGEHPCDVLARIPQARAHPMARAGCEPTAVRDVLLEALERHQAMLSHAAELDDARRELTDADDEGVTTRLRLASQDRLAADARATAERTNIEGATSDSPLQRMLDSEAWRRQPRR